MGSVPAVLVDEEPPAQLAVVVRTPLDRTEPGECVAELRTSLGKVIVNSQHRNGNQGDRLTSAHAGGSPWTGIWGTGAISAPDTARSSASL